MALCPSRRSHRQSQTSPFSPPASCSAPEIASSPEGLALFLAAQASMVSAAPKLKKNQKNILAMPSSPFSETFQVLWLKHGHKIGLNVACWSPLGFSMPHQALQLSALALVQWMKIWFCTHQQKWGGPQTSLVVWIRGLHTAPLVERLGAQVWAWTQRLCWEECPLWAGDNFFFTLTHGKLRWAPKPIRPASGFLGWKLQGFGMLN